MREAKESDYMMPEYHTAQMEGYGFRGDEKVVRKDRLERGICRNEVLENIGYVIGAQKKLWFFWGRRLVKMLEKAVRLLKDGKE